MFWWLWVVHSFTRSLGCSYSHRYESWQLFLVKFLHFHCNKQKAIKKLEKAIQKLVTQHSTPIFGRLWESYSQQPQEPSPYTSLSSSSFVKRSEKSEMGRNTEMVKKWHRGDGWPPHFSLFYSPYLSPLKCEASADERGATAFHSNSPPSSSCRNSITCSDV